MLKKNADFFLINSPNEAKVKCMLLILFSLTDSMRNVYCLITTFWAVISGSCCQFVIQNLIQGKTDGKAGTIR